MSDLRVRVGGTKVFWPLDHETSVVIPGIVAACYGTNPMIESDIPWNESQKPGVLCDNELVTFSASEAKHRDATMHACSASLPYHQAVLIPHHLITPVLQPRKCTGLTADIV